MLKLLIFSSPPFLFQQQEQLGSAPGKVLIIFNPLYTACLRIYIIIIIIWNM